MEKMDKWSDYQRAFDKLEDIDEIFYFLRDLVDILQICENATCTIFPNLYNLDLDRMSYPFKTLKEAQKNLKNLTELHKFEELYFKYILASKQVFAEIYALKVSTETKRTLQNEKDAKFEGYLKICAKYGLTPEMDIQKGIKDIANSYAGGALPLSPIEKSDKSRLEVHVKSMREQEKAEKTAKKKKTKDKDEDEEE